MEKIGADKTELFRVRLYCYNLFSSKALRCDAGRSPGSLDICPAFPSRCIGTVAERQMLTQDYSCGSASDLSRPTCGRDFTEFPFHGAVAPHQHQIIRKNKFYLKIYDTGRRMSR